MKRKITFILSLIFLMGLLLSSCTPQGNKTPDLNNSQAVSSNENSLNGIKDKGKFVVGLDDSFPPMGFRDEKGEIVGFDIDLAMEVAARLGVSVEFKPVDWDGIVLSLNNKDIDVIWNGLTITNDRKKQIDFTKPYLENKQIIVVNSGSTVKSKTDLNGKVVGLQMGSSSQTALEEDADTLNSLKEVKKYSNNTEALMDLANSRVDAVIADEIVARYYISKKPGTYIVLDDNFGTEAYGVGIRKEDKDFREALDNVLDEMKADGTAAKISDKWFGRDIVLK